MICCHFDRMNDKIMFFLSIVSCHCNAYRLVALDCVRFMHPLGVLIVYDWLWLCKSLVEAFEL